MASLHCAAAKGRSSLRSIRPAFDVESAWSTCVPISASIVCLSLSGLRHSVFRHERTCGDESLNAVAEQVAPGSVEPHVQ